MQYLYMNKKCNLLGFDSLVLPKRCSLFQLREIHNIRVEQLFMRSYLSYDWTMYYH